MKTKKPSEMTTEQLFKRQKTIQFMIYILLSASILLLLIIVFLFLKKEFSALIVIPFSMISIIISNSNLLKEIKQEIALREV
jgi:Cu/Ag efflux pump CusA